MWYVWITVGVLIGYAIRAVMSVAQYSDMQDELARECNRNQAEDSINEYQRLAARTLCDGGYANYANMGMGIAGEAGEVCDYLKKVVFHGHTLDKGKLAEELGDCQWYIAGLATLADIPMSDICRGNVDKLRERYPEGFDPKRSIDRRV